MDDINMSSSVPSDRNPTFTTIDLTESSPRSHKKRQYRDSTQEHYASDDDLSPPPSHRMQTIDVNPPEVVEPKFKSVTLKSTSLSVKCAFCSLPCSGRSYHNIYKADGTSYATTDGRIIKIKPHKNVSHAGGAIVPSFMFICDGCIRLEKAVLSGMPIFYTKMKGTPVEKSVRECCICGKSLDYYDSRIHLTWRDGRLCIGANPCLLRSRVVESLKNRKICDACYQFNRKLVKQLAGFTAELDFTEIRATTLQSDKDKCVTSSTVITNSAQRTAVVPVSQSVAQKNGMAHIQPSLSAKRTAAAFSVPSQLQTLIPPSPSHSAPRQTPHQLKNQLLFTPVTSSLSKLTHPHTSSSKSSFSSSSSSDAVSLPHQHPLPLHPQTSQTTTTTTTSTTSYLDMAMLRIRAEQCAKRTCELLAHNMELSDELDRIRKENTKLKEEQPSSSSSSAPSHLNIPSNSEIIALRNENAALKHNNSVLISKVQSPPPVECQVRFFSPAGDLVGVRAEAANVAILKTRIPYDELKKYRIGECVAKPVYFYKGWDIQQNRLHLFPVFFQVSKAMMLIDDPSADVRIVRVVVNK